MHAPSIEIQPAVNAIAVDLTERSGFGKRVEHVCADALTYPLQEASFDAVVSWLAILHILDRRRLCERLARAVRAGAGCYIEDLFKDKCLIPLSLEPEYLA